MIISGVDFFQSPRSPRAKRAREWFAKNGPPDLQPLPLGYAEREHIKDFMARHILAWYARSLADLNYDFAKHPTFYDYACGVMASPVTHALIRDNPELQRRFPPRPLPGLDPHLYWKPLKPDRRWRRSAQASRTAGTAGSEHALVQ
jgi:hypothetical protein